MLTRLRTRLVFFSSLFCHLYHVQCIYYITIIVYIKLLIKVRQHFNNLKCPLGTDQHNSHPYRSDRFFQRKF